MAFVVHTGRELAFGIEGERNHSILHGKYESVRVVTKAI